jgi:hypothetical protein
MKLLDVDIAQEVVQRIKNANESVKGTHDSMKYHMETYYKYGGKWRFLSWGYPIYKVDNIDVYYKKWKDSEYLIFEKSDGEVERYTITPRIKELIIDLLTIDEGE